MPSRLKRTWSTMATVAMRKMSVPYLTAVAGPTSHSPPPIEVAAMTAPGPMTFIALRTLKGRGAGSSAMSHAGNDPWSGGRDGSSFGHEAAPTDAGEALMGRSLLACPRSFYPSPIEVHAMNRVLTSAAMGGVMLAAAAARSQSSPPAFDLVIANGRILDGTGAPWFRGDVGIKGDRITAVGDLSAAAATRRIDARDHMVAPGFIDMLGQSEMTLLADNRAESKIRQGITSEITGEGGSAAPVTEATLQDQRAWLDKYKIKVDWTDFRGYFDALRRARPRSARWCWAPRTSSRRPSSSAAWRRWWKPPCSRARSACRRPSSTRPAPMRRQ